MSIEVLLQNQNVIQVYNEIANHFDVTRAYLWKSIKNFTNSLATNSRILDAGCGNGKNMFRNDCIHIGIDNSIEMVKICQKKKLFVLQADITNIPFRSDLFDATTSVAVIHHLPNKNDRVKAINELVRVTKNLGLIFIQVWDNNLESRKKSKYHKIDGRDDDYLVEWTIKNKKLYRYYHLFSENEINQIVKKIKHVEVVSLYNEMENWVIVLKKNNSYL